MVEADVLVASTNGTSLVTVMLSAFPASFMVKFTVAGEDKSSRMSGCFSVANPDRLTVTV